MIESAQWADSMKIVCLDCKEIGLNFETEGATHPVKKLLIGAETLIGWKTMVSG